MALSETNYALEFLLSEAPGGLSRDEGVLLSGQSLIAGAVVGQITKAIAAAPIPTIVGTGTGLMSALTFGPDVQTGNYVITLTAGGSTAAFSVTAPDGTVLPVGAVGTSYRSTHLNFLISTGGTMTVDDSYTVAVTAGGTPVVIGGTGNGTCSVPVLGPLAQVGGYQLINRAVVAHGGDFELIAPDGKSCGRFLMGTTTGAAATRNFGDHLTVTLTDDTDFILGNYFNLIVAKGSLKFAAVTPTTYDGRHVAAGVITNTVDATDADQEACFIARQAEVSSARLGWGTLTTAQQATATAQLAARGILAR